MKLTSFKYFSYLLNFKNPFTTSAGKLESRKTFIVELEDANESSFYGEAAPLPEFNSNTFEEVENELNTLSHKNEFDLGNSTDEIFEFVNSISSLPTVQYALEQIFVTSLLRKSKSAYPEFTGENGINVNAVMSITDFESSQKQLKDIIADGYSTIKLKANNDNFEELYELITWTVGELRASLKFRIDANCSWDKRTTLQRSERLASLPVEYIEQPVRDRNELIKIAAESPIPIAADESVRNLDEANYLIDNSKLNFLVIKPMLLGGIRNIIKLKKMIEKKDIQIIISSSLESNIGRRHLVLASALIDNNLAHGLGTADLFTNQIAQGVFPVEKGKINFTLDKYLSDLRVSI